MAVLVSAHQIEKSFGSRLLFNDITFAIEHGQRIGLIGPNGAGKSTLLKILAKQETTDAGQLSFNQSCRVGFLEQDPQFTKKQTVLEAVQDYVSDKDDDQHIALLWELIAKLELEDKKAGLDQDVNSLSGGWKKRVALARVLLQRPDLLLLDEPTNHLDVESIEWIEDFLVEQNQMALLMVTHDRLFLQNTCDMIFDLDRKNPKGLIRFQGPYDQFVDFKLQQSEELKSMEATRRNTLRRETAWLRRGAKARQTKQKARIERAGDLKNEVEILAEKNRSRKVHLDFAHSEKAPKKLIDAQNISLRFGEQTLFEGLDLIITPQTRLGLLGTNGSGKTSLIRTLLGLQSPTDGRVKIADGLEYSYFEQGKQSIDPARSVLRNLVDMGDYVDVQGKPVFARSYLSRFHFSPQQMDMPAAKLSGGEKTRLLLAQLMLTQKPLMILDEPTNDLDIETLDTLEDALNNYDGAVLLVSHDRYFLDQVCDQVLTLTPSGKVEIFASLFQWQEWKKNPHSRTQATLGSSASQETLQKNESTTKKKLTYKEQLEFEQIESVIARAEKSLKNIQDSLNSPELQSQHVELSKLAQELVVAQKEVDRLYNRWQELSAKVGQK